MKFLSRFRCVVSKWTRGVELSREVWFESQQNNEAIRVDEVTQGECKRKKRQGPQRTKTFKGHAGEGEAERMERIQQAGCLGRMAQCQVMLRVHKEVDWKVPTGFWIRARIVMLPKG